VVDVGNKMSGSIHTVFPILLASLFDERDNAVDEPLEHFNVVR
jgi:hypothetical protein